MRFQRFHYTAAATMSLAAVLFLASVGLCPASSFDSPSCGEAVVHVLEEMNGVKRSDLSAFRPSTNMLQLRDALASRDIRSEGWLLEPSDLHTTTSLLILHTKGSHFELLTQRFEGTDFVSIYDPDRGRVVESVSTLTERWEGRALVIPHPLPPAEPIFLLSGDVHHDPGASAAPSVQFTDNANRERGWKVGPPSIVQVAINDPAGLGSDRYLQVGRVLDKEQAAAQGISLHGRLFMPPFWSAGFYWAGFGLIEALDESSTTKPTGLWLIMMSSGDPLQTKCLILNRGVEIASIPLDGFHAPGYLELTALLSPSTERGKQRLTVSVLPEGSEIRHGREVVIATADLSLEDKRFTLGTAAAHPHDSHPVAYFRDVLVHYGVDGSLSLGRSSHQAPVPIDLIHERFWLPFWKAGWEIFGLPQHQQWKLDDILSDTEAILAVVKDPYVREVATECRLRGLALSGDWDSFMRLRESSSHAIQIKYQPEIEKGFATYTRAHAKKWMNNGDLRTMGVELLPSMRGYWRERDFLRVHLEVLAECNDSAGYDETFPRFLEIEPDLERLAAVEYAWVCTIGRDQTPRVGPEAILALMEKYSRTTYGTLFEDAYIVELWRSDRKAEFWDYTNTRLANVPEGSATWVALSLAQRYRREENPDTMTLILDVARKAELSPTTAPLLSHALKVAIELPVKRLYSDEELAALEEQYFRVGRQLVSQDAHDLWFRYGRFLEAHRRLVAEQQAASGQ